jgi:hypothetical protein
MMLPPVVVDLGPEVARAQVEIVLEACNDAISRGVCVSHASAGAELPRAIAQARAADASARVVRIEVRLAGGDEAPILRELRFARRDPVAERWRSVGLAIATLVGEGEQRANEQEEAVAGDPEHVEAAPVGVAAQPPAEAPSAPSEPPSESPEPEPPSEPEPPPPEPLEEGRARPPQVVFEPSQPEPPLDWSHRPLFIGLGALVGTGFDAGWRAGGSLRAGWHFEGGLAILAAASYALGTSLEPFAVRWLSLDAGVGYRFALSERLSAGASLLVGAQRTSFELPAPESRSEAGLSPRLGLVGDVWWRAAPPFGLWAALEGSTTGRETRLFIDPDREPERSSPLSAALSAGLGFWFH